MTEQELEILRYPIGRFNYPSTVSSEMLESFIKDIELFPAKIKNEVTNLTDAQLDTPYRPDGWTIRQVVHHCGDSHMNAIIRVKLALTEDGPTIKPYMEDRWAELADSTKLPVAPSLQLIEAVHLRWITVLKSLQQKDFQKTFVHPEHGTIYRLDQHTALYSWHCNHHLTHITALKKRMNWA